MAEHRTALDRAAEAAAEAIRTVIDADVGPDTPLVFMFALGTIDANNDLEAVTLTAAANTGGDYVPAFAILLGRLIESAAELGIGVVASPTPMPPMPPTDPTILN